MPTPRDKARERARAALDAMTPEEDAAINAGISRDPDSPELSDTDVARMRPAADVVPDVVARHRHPRGPQKAPTKQLVSLRLDREVIERFKSGGPGWQVRMNEALRKASGL
ncbi:MAG TPA: BrnA antitoxin family protein [Azospirillum sp.]